MKKKKKNNPYKKLAERFREFECGKEVKRGAKQDKLDDWNFYKYLKSLGYDNKYIFPLNEKESIKVDIDLFNPYVYVESEKEKFIDPRWHLFVSYYAYKDAKYNHPDNEYAKQIKDKNISKEFGPLKGSLVKWLEEQED